MKPIKIANKQSVISASIGVAIEDSSDFDPDTLILNAYTAMMEIKKNNQA